MEVEDDGLTLKPVHRLQMNSHFIPSGLLNLLELDFMFGLFDFTLLPQLDFLPFTIFDDGVPGSQINDNFISIESVGFFGVLINLQDLVEFALDLLNLEESLLLLFLAFLTHSGLLLFFQDSLVVLDLIIVSEIGLVLQFGSEVTYGLDEKRTALLEDHDASVIPPHVNELASAAHLQGTHPVVRQIHYLHKIKRLSTGGPHSF